MEKTNGEKTQIRDQITFAEYVEKVDQMRQSQRQFFRAKGDSRYKYLDRSRELEKEVDQMTAQIKNPQTSMF